MRGRLLIAALLVVGVTAAEEEDISLNSDHWSIDDRTDPFTDERVINAYILSEDGMQGGYIAVGCLKGTFEVKVSTGEYIGSQRRFRPRNNMTYRIDSEEAVTATMKTSDTMVYDNKPKSQFVQDLAKGGGSIIVQLTDYRGRTSRSRYTLFAADETIPKVLEACGK